MASIYTVRVECQERAFQPLDLLRRQGRLPQRQMAFQPLDFPPQNRSGLFRLRRPK